VQKNFSTINKQADLQAVSAAKRHYNEAGAPVETVTVIRTDD